MVATDFDVTTNQGICMHTKVAAAGVSKMTVIIAAMS